MQAVPWLQKVILGLGSLIVIWIGIGLLRSRASLEGGKDVNVPVWKLFTTAFVVTWFNPQAIIDGTLMLGAFAATLSAQQATPFITGVETASVMWFLGVTLVVNAFAHKFNPKIIGVLNRVCGGIIVLYGIKLLVDFAMAVL